MPGVFSLFSEIWIWSLNQVWLLKTTGSHSIIAINNAIFENLGIRIKPVTGIIHYGGEVKPGALIAFHFNN